MTQRNKSTEGLTMEHGLAGRRALFVFDCLELGGAERQGLLLAAHLKQSLGMAVSVLGLSEGQGKISELCGEMGIPWQGVPLDLSRGGIALVRELSRVVGAMRAARPDVILPYTWRPNVACGLTWRLSGARLCVWNQRDEGRGLQSSLRFRLAVKLSSGFVANSQQGKDALLQRYALAAEQVRIIPNGVVLAEPVRDRSAWRDGLGISADCFALGMVANLHFFKDHATLLRAWRTVLDTLGDNADVILLLAGRFSVAEGELRAQARELRLEDKVRFLGGIDDVSGLLGAVDLYAHSSLAEGTPNAVLEAMSAGLAVVATDIPGIRGALGHEGEHGLVPPGDADALAAAILAFMKDRELRERTGRALKERAGRHFAPSAMAQASIALLESLYRK
ncbi:glycosyltransferase [Geomonas anaerohicana]|uniref:Glycosyltransferase n=1 Tax=Geomonas anaerohicana TaxID=2798583 RepID=A0ABS0YGM7_9BACT|nr:glycosyltransferase [Geomonas anaerohicana]MBJ6751455.1 glycosyltransferase [Geomonas anaerohicana]